VSGAAGALASPFRRSKDVSAVAFACVVSFMGIGLKPSRISEYTVNEASRSQA
jgi:hypothetical protein